MANPTSVGVDDNYPAVLEVVNTATRSVTLNSQRSYFLRHLSVDTGGNATTDTIYLAFAAADVDADKSEGADKFALVSGGEVVIGPGVSSLKFETEANDPTMTIMPNRKTFGNW